MKIKKKLSVSELNRLINTEISLSPLLQRVEVEAEVGRMTKHSSGHYYFVIKDKHSSIDCIMFRSAVSKLKADFFEGDFVTLKGRISIYEQNARLQLYVTSVEQCGEGKFLKEFYELKEKLSAQGVFDTKRTLKKFPEKIALFTSKSSAAIRDYKKILRDRNPFVELVEFEINMQSEETPTQIIEALEQVDSSYDLLVITRGGGSYEDLRYFNHEGLARYISSFHIPVISAIGHEIDYTIIEFASDYRAATPTEAAILSTENVTMYLEDYARVLRAVENTIFKDLDIIRLSSDNVLDSIDFVANKKITASLFEIDAIKKETESVIFNKIAIEKEKLNKTALYLENLNPIHIMNKGYVLAQKGNTIISSIEDIKIDDDITLKLKNGRAIVTVREVFNEGFKKN